MKIEWDERKNRINIWKHGVSFEEASTVFFDEDALLEYDENHSDSEDRFKLLGRSFNGNILLVVHCVRDQEDLIRIISSRKATKTEEINYGKVVQL